MLHLTCKTRGKILRIIFIKIMFSTPMNLCDYFYYCFIQNNLHNLFFLSYEQFNLDWQIWHKMFLFWGGKKISLLETSGKYFCN